MGSLFRQAPEDWAQACKEKTTAGEKNIGLHPEALE